MMKLYRNMERPGNWIAYVPESGWVTFPAVENGWEHRQPARGLDPLHLREAPLSQAAECGVPQPVPSHRPVFARVA